MSRRRHFVDDVVEFYRKVLNHHAPPDPTPLDRETSDYRITFLQEEVDEYVLAREQNDLAGQLDALVDLVYVAIGTAVAFHGFDFEEAWRRVHAANLAKIGAGPSGKRGGHALDVGKPPDWAPPDLSDLVAPFAGRQDLKRVTSVLGVVDEIRDDVAKRIAMKIDREMIEGIAEGDGISRCPVAFSGEPLPMRTVDGHAVACAVTWGAPTILCSCKEVV